MADEQLPDYVIEGARSGRSRCKTCRKTITKGVLRIGVLIEGPFGEGYLWHHLNCLAKSRINQVEAAYDETAWENAKEPPKGLPAIEKLRGLKDKAAKKQVERREIPYAEIAPSSRSKCKLCGDPINQGELRVVLSREVSFGQQVRAAPVKIHPECVTDELERGDSAVELDGFDEALRKNSKDLDPAKLDELCNSLDVG